MRIRREIGKKGQVVKISLAALALSAIVYVGAYFGGIYQAKASLENEIKSTATKSAEDYKTFYENKSFFYRL